jgi:hypothetical protein
MARGKLQIKCPVTIVFKTGKRTVKMKTVKNRTIDELFAMDFNIPGIKAKDEIMAVGLGEDFDKYYKTKFKIK